MIPPLADIPLFAEALQGFTETPVLLSLLVDKSPTMKVWLPTISAFHDTIAGSGAFPQVDWHDFGSGAGHPKGPPPPGKHAVLVFSDGLGDLWRQEEPFRVLRTWCRSAPVALINPYPQGHWHRTNLPLHEIQLRALGPMAPNRLLEIRNPPRHLLGPPLRPEGLAVPVLELDPQWLRWWKRLVQGGEATWYDAIALIAGPRAASPATEPAKSALPDADEPADLVFRFRADVSEPAFQLAIYAAAAPADIDAVRAVQDRLLPETLPLHLAEVIASPILVEPGVATDGDFAFRDGVREALLACGTRAGSARVIETLADYYGERMPQVQSLLRALQAPDEQPDTPVTSQNLSFARVELAVLRALSGPYAKRAKRLSQYIARVGHPQPTQMTTATESGEIVSTPSPSTPLQHPSVLRALTDPAVSGESAISVDTLLSDRVRTAHESVWGNVPPRNGDFTGRAELLDELERRLQTGPVTAVLPQALHGMGGVGKSQIATEYAYLHRYDYDVIWWIPAEQPAQILRALIDLGQRLGLDVGPEANTAVPAVQEALRAGAPYPNWLLIFDNAENVETVSPYFPESGTGKVLVTSRNPEWTGVARALEIDVFTRAESIELLRKGNATITVEEADRMAVALSDLPLAVAQAAAWLATTKMPVAEYLRLLEVKRLELQDEAIPPGYEMPVAAAWNVALDRLGVENPGALKLLQVCSFFAPEPIGRGLFTSPRNAPISPELDATLQNPSRLNRAIRDIQRYGLARIDYRDQTVHLHRLVKSVLNTRLSESQRNQLQHGAHVLLAGGNPGNPSSTEEWQRYLALVPHVVASDAVGCTDPWVRQLVLDVIEFYYFWGNHGGCRDLARQVVEAWRVSLGPDDLQTLHAAKWLGFVLRILGDFANAAAINRDCLERFERIAGPDDEGTLDAMSLVAADLRAEGKFQEARDLDEKALKACRQAFGEDDPQTLNAAHSLGVSLRLTGEFRRALELDADTCRRRVRVLGPDHALTLLTLNGFVLDLRECGDYLQAHEDHEKLYERFQHEWRQDHLQTIIAARSLAVSRRRAGFHESGRKLAQDAMKRLQQRFGAMHPEAIAASLNYAVDVRENDELEASQALAERTYHDYETLLGPSHPYTLYARTNLAIVLRLLGQTEAALAHNRSAYELLRESLGPDHVLTLTCATNLASDHAAMGRHQAAHDLDTDILARSSASLGPRHPSTLACSLNLAFDLIALGRQEDGERRFEEVLTTFAAVLGERHPVIAAAHAHVRANCDVDPMPL